jgi:hypothetical protein
MALVQHRLYYVDATEQYEWFVKSTLLLLHDVSQK